MILKKLSCILCFIVVFLSITSCSSVGVTSLSGSDIEITSSESSQITSQSEHIFSLPYFENDSLNPFSAKQNVNFYLGTLVYDSLFKIDESFNPVPKIAKEFFFEGNNCIVKIRNDIKFSDGSLLTVGDVASSFQAAKNSAHFSQRLSSISGYNILDDSIIFKLNQTDKNVIKNLTFPITKNGSNQSAAIGSGRYCFNIQDKPTKLIKNEHNVDVFSSEIKDISLVSIHKYSTLPYMLKIGSVNFVYAESNNTLANAAVKTSKVLMNNLVFVGINGYNQVLSNQDFRKAVSLVVNRKSILSDVYANNGFATAQPFHPMAKSFENSFEIDLTNRNAATELLSVAGFVQKDTEGFLVLNEQRITLRLLVNHDNPARVKAAEILKLNLQTIGVAVEIISENTENYKSKIASGDYDLYIGEIKLTPDNNISRLLNDVSINLSNDGGETFNAYLQYLSGEITINDFLKTFDLKTPFLPLLYKNGTAVYSGSIKISSSVTEYDVFANMDKWSFN